MDAELELLRDLCMTPGVPGAEDRVRSLIEARATGFFDSKVMDPFGNLILTRHSRTAASEVTRVLLLCHMDEIGFMVSHVDQQGFIFVQPTGGFDPRTLFGRRVLVCTENGDFKGVMNPIGKPLHTSSLKDREKVPEIGDFFVDVGMGPKAKEVISIGDYVVMDEPFIELEDKCISKALDNRVACWLGLEVLRLLANDAEGHACELSVAFTVQEEVGVRGAKTAAFLVRPHYAIGVDTTLSCDLPGVTPKDYITTQGDGFGLHLKDNSMIADRSFARLIESIAKDNSIPFQRTMLPAGGQDGSAAQQSAGGAKTASVVVGTRYIHTVTEMVDKVDLFAARKILVEIAKSIG
ncbi:MAG: M42 family peptidase [Rhodobacter sp.]|nr:M42 family peptidase [Rhodobacter sp.]